jgi:hypothetical protein
VVGLHLRNRALLPHDANLILSDLNLLTADPHVEL